MNVGDEVYRKRLRRYNTLLWLDAPTVAQQAEMARLDKELTEAELKGRGLRGMVSDYDLVMNAGDLGGVEL